MYYIYFPYVLIVGLLMLYECHTKGHPKWWAAIVAAAPVTTPYFIFKSRQQTGIKIMVIFLASFLSVCVVEGVLYSRYMHTNQYDHLPPVARKIVYLSEEVKTSTIALDAALIKLENLSKVEARVKRIKQTIDFIKELRVLMYKNQNAIQSLVKYTSENKKMFSGSELEWVFTLQRYYNNWNVVQHYKSLKRYLDDFQELLEYTYINFYNIKDHKIQKHLKNYDELYLRYRRSVDSHNRFNVKRIDFQNKFLLQYPDIKSYLPGERQTDTFKLWE